MKSFSKIVAFILIHFCFVLVRAQDIYIACYNGDMETVKRLANADPALVNSLNANGRFPLEMAAQTGQTEIVRFLLEKGADVKLNRGGVTALHMAALDGGKTELVTLLLKNGAEMNARTGNGDTPLNLAVYGKQREIANLLLDQGAQMNLENQDFTRLLQIAASGGIKRIADIVLKKGVDFSYRAEDGGTLLHSAAAGGLTGLAELLLSKGLKMETANIYGQTPLHAAAAAGHLDVVELFLNKGVEMNVKTKNGKTALHLARDKGHENVVEVLKKKGADAAEWRFPKLTGKYLDQPPPGETPLMFAPGIVSDQEHFEHSCLAFAPDYSEVYWSTDFTESGFYDIVYMKKENNRWSAPGLAPFSGKYHAGSPVFSCDGKKLYFSSARPRDERSGGSDVNIWVVEKSGAGWSEPKALADLINSAQGESVLSITREGTLYFRRDMQLFRARQKEGVFLPPEKLDMGFKPEARTLALFVAPDERYMLLEVMGGGGQGSGDIFIRYHKKDGSWSEPVNPGAQINTGGLERFPSVSPDGNYLFFLRVSDGSDFYWVDAKIVENFMPKELK